MACGRGRAVLREDGKNSFIQGGGASRLRQEQHRCSIRANRGKGGSKPCRSLDEDVSGGATSMLAGSGTAVQRNNQPKARPGNSNPRSWPISASAGSSAVPAKARTLREFSARFFQWVDNTHRLKPNTRRYYRYGWKRLKSTPLAGMRLDAITTDLVSTIPFSGSTSWANQARRTLRVMLGKAVRDNLVRQAPLIHLAEEIGRDGILDDATEQKLLAVARQPLRDVLVIMRDMGLRPTEVFRMRWEHVHAWSKRLQPTGCI